MSNKLISQYDWEKIQNKIKTQKNEISRLNSIINKLEQLLEKELDMIKDEEIFSNLSNEDYIEFILDKIQELKEKYK